MSRSYRKPYAAVCGVISAKQDKQLASRGVRRRTNQWLHVHLMDENFDLPPHKFECSHNETYTWNRDGGKRFQSPTKRDWSEYIRYQLGLFYHPNEEAWMKKFRSSWPPKWYAEYTRK